MKNIVFISHRSTDKQVAELLITFLLSIGLPENQIFCSSSPGKDVKERIGKEVREKLKESAVIILLLSMEYYNSAYCLNEAGVAWYLDNVITIPIGLPGFDESMMDGFYDKEYKLRFVNDVSDIVHVFTTVSQRLGISSPNDTNLRKYISNLHTKYQDFAARRAIEVKKAADETVPELTPEERSLLIAGSEDSLGQIRNTTYKDDQIITANGKSFNTTSSPREIARWKASLNKMVDWGIIEVCDDKRKIFSLTDKGFRYADKLQQNRDK